MNKKIQLSTRIHESYPDCRLQSSLCKKKRLIHQTSEVRKTTDTKENLEKLFQAFTKFFVTADVQQKLIEWVLSRHLGAAATAAAIQLHIW